MRQRGKIVLLHFVGQMPLAGIAWQAVNYLVGLERLGFEAWYVEDHGANPYDPRISSVVMECGYNVAYLRAAMERHGFAGRWAYWDAINDVYHGLSREKVHALYAEADGLINLCGATQLRDEHLRCPVRIIVDTDPVYEQIKYAKADPAARAYVDAHTHFFTYGANLGSNLCQVPLCGVPWRPTRPPVDLDLWPPEAGEPPCFTTIATWENKGKNIEFEGNDYLWSKHVNFLKFLDLPRHRPQTCFQMAMLPPDEDVRRQVEAAGWGVVDPRPVSADMASYQRFIAGSRGEFTVAKDIYVRPNSGWFSDRAVCYLAAGRPVVTMRTGFTSFCPAGAGLFDYTTHDGVLAAIDAIATDYPRHSRAARELAGDYFGAERVIGGLLKDVAPKPRSGGFLGDQLDSGVARSANESLKQCHTPANRPVGSVDSVRTFLPARFLPTHVARAAGPASDAVWDSLAGAVLFVAAVLVVLTFTDYGVTWDADLHNAYGVMALDYYLSGFADQRALHFPDLYNYGAAFDMIAAALNRFSPLGIFETRHLLDGFVGILGLAGCWKLGQALGGPRAGFIALVLLLLTPNYYGQMFNNPKDIPFAVGGIWAIYYIVRMLPALPRSPMGLVLKLGLAIGLALGVRVGGLLFLCYLGLLLGLSALWQGIEARRASVMIAACWTSLWRVLLPSFVIADAVMLLCWPWGQQDPLRNPLRALAFFSHQQFPYATLFDGRSIPANDLPWQYLPTYILLALPEFILALLIIVVVLTSVGAARRGLAAGRERVLGLFLLGFAIVFPVAYAITIKAVLFDGMRHFIFVLPPIAVAAALAGDRVLRWLAGFPYRRPVYAALGLYGIAHVATMAMLHPDQYVYYNAFVGGVDGAKRRFKLDYWANSYAEDVRGLAAILQNQYGSGFAKHKFTVAVCGPPAPAAYYFPGNFRFMAQRDKADFFIAFTKDNCDRTLPGRPIYRVARMGALLSVVLDRRSVLAGGRVGKIPVAHLASPQAPVSAYP